MDEDLISDETLPLSRKSKLPGEGFFRPDKPSTAEEIDETDLATRERVIIADPDPDGLACVAIIESVEDDALLIPTGPHELQDALSAIADYARADLVVFVCDLSPDRFSSVEEPLSTLAEAGSTVRWFDHHQWGDDVVDAVRDLGVDLTVGDSETECTADVAVRALEAPIPDHLIELAVVTRDHDLWIKEDPRSDDLADYAYWSDPADYVDTVEKHGPDMPDEVQALLTERRAEKDALIDRAVDRARLVEIGDITIGVTYGRCSQNEVAEALRQQGADASVVVKPAGSASIRGSETFERCHEVAERVGGGGHPRAAGCKPDIYDDMLDYAHHWVTEGAVTQRTILDAFESVVSKE